MKALEFDKKTSAKITETKKRHVTIKKNVHAKKTVEESPSINEEFSVAGISFSPGSNIHRQMQSDSAMWQKMKNWD